MTGGPVSRQLQTLPNALQPVLGGSIVLVNGPVGRLTRLQPPPEGAHFSPHAPSGSQRPFRPTPEFSLPPAATCRHLEEGRNSKAAGVAGCGLSPLPEKTDSQRGASVRRNFTCASTRTADKTISKRTQTVSIADSVSVWICPKVHSSHAYRDPAGQRASRRLRRSERPRTPWTLPAEHSFVQAVCAS